MSQNKKTDSREFNALKKLGFGFRALQDEFSYQPDSGGIATGKIGEQEYGIDIDTDAKPYGNDIAVEGNAIEDSTNPIPGESEWSQQHRLPEDVEEEENQEITMNESDRHIRTLIQNRFSRDPALKLLDISIQVEGGGVILAGGVPDNTTLLLMSKIVRSLPGVASLTNQMIIMGQG